MHTESGHRSDKTPYRASRKKLKGQKPQGSKKKNKKPKNQTKAKGILGSVTVTKSISPV